MENTFVLENNNYPIVKCMRECDLTMEKMALCMGLSRPTISKLMHKRVLDFDEYVKVLIIYRNIINTEWGNEYINSKILEEVDNYSIIVEETLNSFKVW